MLVSIAFRLYVSSKFWYCFYINSCSSSAEKRLLEDLLETIFRSSLAGGNVNISSLRLLSCHFNMAALAANEDVFEHSSAILVRNLFVHTLYPHVLPWKRIIVVCR